LLALGTVPCARFTGQYTEGPATDWDSRWIGAVQRTGVRGGRRGIGAISATRWARRDRAAVDRSGVSGRPET